MRVLIRVLLGLAVLVALALGGLALMLPRLIDSPAVRDRIQKAAQSAVGREVRYESLSFGLLPPRLVVRRPEVAGARAGEPASLEAQEVGLRLALAPLLARTLVIESLVVEGATVRLARTRDGFELPISKPAEPGSKPPGGAGEQPSPEASTGAGLQLAVRSLTLRDARIVLEDRSVSPTVTWDLGKVNGSGRADSLDGPIPFDVSAELASGGRLRASGTFHVSGALDAKVELDAFSLAPAAPYLGKDLKLEGKLSGNVQARGAGPVPDHVVADLTLDGGNVRMNEMLLRGRMALTAELEGVPDAPAGTFRIDATGAEVAYGEVFKKPAGTEGTVSGRIVPQSDGSLGLDGVRLHVRNLDAEAKVRTGKRLRAEVSAPRFDVAGWEQLVPALAGRGLVGGVRVEKLAVATGPLDVRGRIHLEDLRVTVPDSGTLRVRGALDAEGTTVRTRDLSVVTEEQTLNVDAELSGLDSRPRYRVKVETEAADTNRLLSAFTSVKETLYGPLALRGTFTGPLGGDQDVVSALGGQVRLDLGRGRLKGVSLLKKTFERMGTLGEFALLAGALRGGRTLQRFYEDEFEAVTGTFELAGGQARTNDLQIVYRNYKVDLRGTLGLTDRKLDATGKLTIDEKIDQALVAEAAAATGETAPPAEARVIPLAHVTGTLSDPRIDLSPQALTALASSYTVKRYTGKYEKKIDEVLGEGSGKQVIDALEGILGGRGR